MLTARPKRAATLDDFIARLNAAILLPACQSFNQKHSTVELKSVFTKCEKERWVGVERYDLTGRT
jgi:hypothetical protein